MAILWCLAIEIELGTRAEGGEDEWRKRLERDGEVD
jgi:hypothetical protein